MTQITKNFKFLLLKKLFLFPFRFAKYIDNNSFPISLSADAFKFKLDLFI